MKGTLTTAALALAATLAVAIPASAEIAPVPTRAEYVATADPICKANADTNKPLLKSAKQMADAGKLKAASGGFARVAANFGTTLKGLKALPRPPEDNAKLEKWFGFLKILQTNLAKVGKALKEENKVKATHEKIRVERSSNAANNVIFEFDFQSCHLKPAQFR